MGGIITFLQVVGVMIGIILLQYHDSVHLTFVYVCVALAFFPLYVVFCLVVAWGYSIILKKKKQ